MFSIFHTIVETVIYRLAIRSHDLQPTTELTGVYSEGWPSEATIFNLRLNFVVSTHITCIQLKITLLFHKTDLLTFIVPQDSQRVLFSFRYFI